MLVRARLFVLPALLAVLSASQVWAVPITPRLGVGGELSYEIGFVLERGLVLGAGEDRLVQQAGLDLEVTGVDDAGVATVAGDLAWVVIDLDRASFRVRVDTRDLQGDSPNLAETTIREMAQLYLDAELEFRVSPEGEILSVGGLEAVMSKINESKGTLARLAAGRLVPETLAQDLAPIWNADGAAGRDLSVGDGWTESRDSALGAGVSMLLETAWSVTEVTDESVSYEGPVTTSIVLPEMEQELPVTFEITEQSGASASVWSLTAGALALREASLTYTVSVAVADQSQKSSRLGTSTLRLLSSKAGG